MTYKEVKPATPDPILNRKTAPSTCNRNQNWYRRNVKKDMPPLEYFDGVEAALERTGL